MNPSVISDTAAADAFSVRAIFVHCFFAAGSLVRSAATRARIEPAGSPRISASFSAAVSAMWFRPLRHFETAAELTPSAFEML